MPCVIDKLPEVKRKEVVSALLAGETLRKVAVMAGVSHTQVAEYKKKVVAPTLRAAQKLHAVQIVADSATPSAVSPEILTRASIAIAPFISRIAQHRATVDAKMVDADGRTAASLISADLKGLELEARVTGLLDGPSHITVNNVAVLLSPKVEEENIHSIDVTAEESTT